jgi:hypothetical protein
MFQFCGELETPKDRCKYFTSVFVNLAAGIKQTDPETYAALTGEQKPCGKPDCKCHIRRQALATAVLQLVEEHENRFEMIRKGQADRARKAKLN